MKEWADGVEVAVGLDESALGEGLAGGVLHREVDPGFVEVALFGDEGVADALVLNDDVGDEGFAGRNGEAGEAERGDEDLILGGCFRAFFFEGKNVDVEDAFAVEAVLEEVGDFLRLLIDICSTAGMSVLPPSQRWETSLAVLGAGVDAPAGSGSRSMWQVWQVETTSLR